jgi:hypothetical protein
LPTLSILVVGVDGSTVQGIAPKDEDIRAEVIGKPSDGIKSTGIMEFHLTTSDIFYSVVNIEECQECLQ